MAKPEDKTLALGIDEVFEKLGGSEGLLLWASSSPERLDKFYQWYLGKRLPNQLSGPDGAPLVIRIKDI